MTIHGWVYHLEDVSIPSEKLRMLTRQGTIRDLDISQGPPGAIPGKKTMNNVWF